MSKKETIARLAPAFLKGRSEEFIQRFYAKEMSKQYSSIMTWKRKQKLREAKPSSSEDLLEPLLALPNKLQQCDDLKPEMLDQVFLAAEELKSTVIQLREKLRQQEISALKRQQEDIIQRLKELRADSEPTLFDNFDQ